MIDWTAAARALSLLAAICAWTPTVEATPLPLSVIPKPEIVQRRSGEFIFTARTRIAGTGDVDSLAGQLRAYLGPAMGFALPTARTARRGDVSLALDRKLKRLGPEGYRLEIANSGVRITAFAPAGIFYAIQTLRQLLPAEAMLRSRVEGRHWSVPAVLIEDSPRFRWRGAHLDVARQFMGKDVVLKFLDLLAMHKLNFFHWHLTDNEGWRIEIRKFPRLTQMGGPYYTQQEIREVVRYAEARHITVVPEIEMPGHSAAAIAAYPELGNKRQALAANGKPVSMKGRDAEYNAEESTIDFLQSVLAETMALFPGRFIHIGGDEFNLQPWRANPAVQRRIRDLGLREERALQAWFIGRFEKFAASHGRRAVGWDEILVPGLLPDTVVMSWRGAHGGIAAAKSGHDVVSAPAEFTYLDSYQWIAPRMEPVARGGFLPLEKIYAFEPVPDELSPDEARRILGGQAQLWTESISSPRALEYAAWPRLCALAEVLWSPRKTRDFVDFIARLKPGLEKLALLDVHFRPLTPIPAPAAKWKAADAPTNVRVNGWDIPPSVELEHGLEVVFVKTGGRGHVELGWVELIGDGKVLRRLTRAGSTDLRQRSNAYRFELPHRSAAIRYTVRAAMRGVGGAATSGEIYILPVESGMRP